MITNFKIYEAKLTKENKVYWDEFFKIVKAFIRDDIRADLKIRYPENRYKVSKKYMWGGERCDLSLVKNEQYQFFHCGIVNRKFDNTIHVSFETHTTLSDMFDTYFSYLIQYMYSKLLNQNFTILKNGLSESHQVMIIPNDETEKLTKVNFSINEFKVFTETNKYNI